MVYPDVTLPLCGSTFAWFRGWAIVPTMRAADPGGSKVSASTVMMYFTMPKALRVASSAQTGRKEVSLLPLKKRPSSWSFPRLRSHPIQVSWEGFHKRLR